MSSCCGCSNCCFFWTNAKILRINAEISQISVIFVNEWLSHYSVNIKCFVFYQIESGLAHVSRNQDSKQLFGQRRVKVGIVGNTSLLACWHWPNIRPTLTFQQLKYCCWPNVGTSTTHQRCIFSCGTNVGSKTCLPTIERLSSLTSNLF